MGVVPQVCSFDRKDGEVGISDEATDTQTSQTSIHILQLKFICLQIHSEKVFRVGGFGVQTPSEEVLGGVSNVNYRNIS